MGHFLVQILQLVDFQFRHVIRNILIDYGGAERIVLADSEDNAFQILQEKTDGFVPNSVRLPTGRKVYMSRNSKVENDHRIRIDVERRWYVGLSA